MFLLVRMIQKKSNSISFHHCFYIFINMSKNTRVRQTHALNDEPVVIETLIVSALLSNATWRITDSNRWPPACKAGALASWANPPWNVARLLSSSDLAQANVPKAVNLPGTTSYKFGGLAQLARAPALQAGGQRFESVILHTKSRGRVRETSTSFLLFYFFTFLLVTDLWHIDTSKTVS